MDYNAARERMVGVVRGHGIHDPAILGALERVPRHAFIPESFRGGVDPYGDYPCPIGGGQTISQPYIVAHMTELAHIRPGSRVLEIGTGSGYQTAVLAELGAQVFSVERIAGHADRARLLLREMGYTTVLVRHGDGAQGWAEHAPYDAIVMTCAPRDIPRPLLQQLAVGGYLIGPVGEDAQRLVLARRGEQRIEYEDDLWVCFVPLVSGIQGEPAEADLPENMAAVG